MRIWLVRLGLDGKEAKETRRVLLQNLKGHTAFRTEADKEKWMEKNSKKKMMHLEDWKSDYQAMQGSMIYNNPPSFEELLQSMAELEMAFKKQF